MKETTSIDREAGGPVGWLRSHPLLAVLLVLAVVARVAFEGVYVDFNQDKARQLVIAQWLSEGHGISFCTADPANLSAVVCERIRYWAVGYPILISLVDFAVGDFVRSSVIVDAIGVAVLVGALHSLLRQLGIRGKAYGLFMVFTALTFTPYYQSGSTDMISAGLYVLAVAWALRASEEESTRMLRFVAIGVLVFGACFLRYAYYPFVVVLPAFLLLSGLRKRGRGQFIGAGVVLVSTALPLLCLLGFYHHYFGSALYLKGTDTLFPEHLLHTAPFPLDSLIYTELFEDNLRAALPSVGALLQPGTWILSLAILAVIAGHFLAHRARGAGDPARGAISAFFVLFAATAALNVAFLAWYSLKNPPQRDWIEFWTYVQERRYYTPTMLLVQVAVALAWSRRSIGGKWTRRGAAAVVSLALVFTVSYAAYRAVKVHGLGVPTIFDGRVEKSERVGQLIERLGDEEDVRIVYADGMSLHDSCLVALRYRTPIVLDYAALVSAPPRASSSELLLVNVPRDRSPAETAWLASANARIVLEGGRADVFRIDLPLETPQ